MQSEAIILIELLNIFFIDNTHLVLALADILHEEQQIDLYVVSE